jgi:hypothetical protein
MRSLIAIQDGQISLAQIKQLEASVRDLYRQHIGPHKLTVIWNVADAQHTITDRKWSQSSSCSVAVPDGFSNAKRETFLLELDRNWRAITGQHPDQTSFVAFDETRFQEVLSGNLERLSPLGRFLFLTRMTVRLMRSKRRTGVLITRFNQ